mgnify:CR=1 FL=1
MQADELVHGAPDQNELLKQLVWPPSYQNPIPKKKYHLVVIGAGPAGLIASISAAGLGANVALVEKAHMGCLLYTSPSPRDQRGSRIPSYA